MDGRDTVTYVAPSGLVILMSAADITITIIRPFCLLYLSPGR